MWSKVWTSSIELEHSFKSLNGTIWVRRSACSWLAIEGGYYRVSAVLSFVLLLNNCPLVICRIQIVKAVPDVAPDENVEPTSNDEKPSELFVIFYFITFVLQNIVLNKSVLATLVSVLHVSLSRVWTGWRFCCWLNGQWGARNAFILWHHDSTLAFFSIICHLFRDDNLHLACNQFADAFVPIIPFKSVAIC